jgi:hypothetical protein
VSAQQSAKSLIDKTRRAKVMLSEAAPLKGLYGTLLKVRKTPEFSLFYVFNLIIFHD